MTYMVCFTCVTLPRNEWLATRKKIFSCRHACVPVQAIAAKDSNSNLAVIDVCFQLDLGFTCRWLPDYGGPSLDLGASSNNATCASLDAVEYVPVGQTAFLKCMHANFPVLSNG